MIIFACIFLIVFVYSVVMLDACVGWALQFALLAAFLVTPAALMIMAAFGWKL